MWIFSGYGFYAVCIQREYFFDDLRKGIRMQNFGQFLIGADSKMFKKMRKRFMNIPKLNGEDVMRTV